MIQSHSTEDIEDSKVVVNPKDTKEAEKCAHHSSNPAQTLSRQKAIGDALPVDIAACHLTTIERKNLTNIAQHIFNEIHHCRSQ